MPELIRDYGKSLQDLLASLFGGGGTSQPYETEEERKRRELMDALIEWQNNPAVPQGAAGQAPMTPEEHEIWKRTGGKAWNAEMEAGLSPARAAVEAVMKRHIDVPRADAPISVAEAPAARPQWMADPLNAPEAGIQVGPLTDAAKARIMAQAGGTPGGGSFSAAEVSPEAQQRLDAVAEWLKDAPTREAEYQMMAQHGDKQLGSQMLKDIAVAKKEEALAQFYGGGGKQQASGLNEVRQQADRALSVLNKLQSGEFYGTEAEKQQIMLQAQSIIDLARQAEANPEQVGAIMQQIRSLQMGQGVAQPTGATGQGGAPAYTIRR